MPRHQARSASAAHRRPRRSIALAALGLGYLRFGTGDDPVSVPARRARRPADPRSRAPTRPSTAATPPTAARSSCPRTAPIPRSRLIALPVTRIRARSAHPGRPIFRLEGGPGLTNMEFPTASRFADRPRRRARRLPRRRRLVAARLPGGRVGAASTRRDLLSATSSAPYADGLPGVRRPPAGDGVDLAGYTLPRAGRRPRGRARAPSATGASTCSARAPARARR